MINLTVVRDWVAFCLEAIICGYVVAEYYYDKEKDLAKQHKRTKTSKKTTIKPGGENIMEEVSETVEPLEEEGK